MSLPQGFSRSGDAVVTTSSAPEVLYCGLGALNTGALCTTFDAPLFFPNGIPTNAAGSVCITTTPTSPVSYSNGMQFDATGRLVVTSVPSSPLFSNAGLMFDATGSLIVSDAPPPVFYKILMETSGAMLLESGDYVLMEA